MHGTPRTRATLLGSLFLAAPLLVGACAGDDADAAADGASPQTADAASPADLEAALDAEAAQVREETDAPDLDVCGLLDTDALVEVMPNPDDDEISVRPRDGLFGPQCSFSGGRPAYHLTARVGASSLSMEEELGVNQDAPELTDVGEGVRYYFNPNFSDQRSYVFTARELTFKVTTEFEGEAASREFAHRAVSMIRE